MTNALEQSLDAVRDCREQYLHMLDELLHIPRSATSRHMQTTCAVRRSAGKAPCAMQARCVLLPAKQAGILPSAKLTLFHFVAL